MKKIVETMALHLKMKDGTAFRHFSLLLLGLVLLVMYHSGFANLNAFDIPNLAYNTYDTYGANGGDLSNSMMLYLHPQVLSSMLWRLLFLLPATVCLAIPLTLNQTFAPAIGVATAFLRSRRFIAVMLGVVLAALLLMILGVTGGRPIVDDEGVYLFQARTYVQGHVVLPAPPAAAAFDNLHMMGKPYWAGKYLFGHPLFLALGVMCGSPFVATILLSLASVWFVYRIGLQQGSALEAALAAVLLGVSPWFLLTSSFLFSHVSMLFVYLLSLYLFFKMERTSSLTLAFGLGLAIGWGFSVRPLSALLLSLPIIGWMGWRFLMEGRRWLPRVIAFGAGFILVAGAILAFNQQVTGNPLLTPFQFNSPEEKIGFGATQLSGQEYVHTPLKGLFNLGVTTLRINDWLFGWPLSLLPIMVFLLFLWFSPSRNGEIKDQLNHERFWLVTLVVYGVGHMVYYSTGVSDTGPIYYFELLPPICLLSARGLVRLHQWVNLRCQPGWRNLVPVFCLLSVLGAFGTVFPEKIRHIMHVQAAADKPYRLAEQSIQGKALVFVGRKPHFGWLFNLPLPHPDFRDRIIYLRLVSETITRQAIDAFPGRKAYVLNYSAQSGEYSLNPYQPSP